MLQRFANLCGKRDLKSRASETTGKGPRAQLSVREMSRHGRSVSLTPLRARRSIATATTDEFKESCLVGQTHHSSR